MYIKLHVDFILLEYTHVSVVSHSSSFALQRQWLELLPKLFVTLWDFDLCKREVRSKVKVFMGTISLACASSYLLKNLYFTSENGRVCHCVLLQKLLNNDVKSIWLYVKCVGHGVSQYKLYNV